ncbi:MAG TPA: Fur family transcriptional regulator [Microbacterium sp.]|nr:Fur family transcriptional regulator [Microbacterium sp.]
MTSAHSTHRATDAHERLHRGSPDAAADAAIAALRDHGERVTGARRAVLETLARTHEHVTADQVVAMLESSRPDVHRATVYRTLDLLTELGVVSHLHASGGATVYHLAASPVGHEHLHAHCRLCGKVVVIAADALAAASDHVAEGTGFRIEPAQSTLVGVCAECAASQQHRSR